MRRAPQATLVVLVALALALLVAGCGASPGSGGDEPRDEAPQGPARVDVANAGEVTLTVWDQEVRGGQAAQIRRLNAAFERRYPNVTIERVARSFTDLNTTLKLALSGDDAPDVVQANQGRPVMGQLVRGGLLRPLTRYAQAFGWEDRYSEVLLDLNRFSPDGRRFGEGELFGLSQMGEIVGLFFDTRAVPTPPRTFAELEGLLEQAERDGDVPVAFGNLDGFPGIHLFQAVQNAFTPPRQTRDLVFARPGARFDTPENVAAATRLREWVQRGWLTPDFAGTSYDDAWQQFARGRGRFLVAGTWLVADLAERMGDRVGFVPVPTGGAGADPVALGGESLPFAVTRRSEHPDVAAAYIDFLTTSDAARVLVETGNLPAVRVDAPSATPLGQDVQEAWTTLTEREALVPYLDYATPTFYDDLTEAIQRLLAGRRSPAEFTRDVQGEYAEFVGDL